jgi:hypothetical protein
MDLINETSTKILLYGLYPAYNPDVLGSGSIASTLKRFMYATRHEVEYGPALHLN